MILDFYNIRIGKVKKLVPNFSDKSMCFIMKTYKVYLSKV